MRLIAERLYTEFIEDEPARLRFDERLPDEPKADVILTNRDYDNLYVVTSQRPNDRVATYAPFTRNPWSGIDQEHATEVFRAIKGQSNLIIMDPDDKARLLTYGAQVVKSKIGDVFRGKVTHVFVAPSASALASEFAATCMEVMGAKGGKLSSATNLGVVHRKTDDLTKIHISPEYINYTYNNIMQKDPTTSSDDAEERATHAYEDAVRALEGIKQRLAAEQAAWDANGVGNRPKFGISGVPQRYRMWLEGFIENDPAAQERMPAQMGTVIIVDDNVDTGQTIYQMARLLRNAGAQHVVGVALYKFRATAQDAPQVRKFWTGKVATWTDQNVKLARVWLASMKTGKPSKPPVDPSFAKKFANDVEPLILRLEDEIKQRRLRESIRQFVRLLI